MNILLYCLSIFIVGVISSIVQEMLRLPRLGPNIFLMVLGSCLGIFAAKAGII